MFLKLQCKHKPSLCLIHTHTRTRTHTHTHMLTRSRCPPPLCDCVHIYFSIVDYMILKSFSVVYAFGSLPSHVCTESFARDQPPTYDVAYMKLTLSILKPKPCTERPSTLNPKLLCGTQVQYFTHSNPAPHSLTCRPPTYKLKETVKKS